MRRWTFAAVYVIGGVSLEDQIRELEDRLGMSRSTEVEETGRTVAFLQD